MPDSLRIFVMTSTYIQLIRPQIVAITGKASTSHATPGMQQAAAKSFDEALTNSYNDKRE
jgi:hypothetical protein